MVLWLGLHWASIAELHHFLNISSVLEALNKFWIDRVYGSVKLETIYLLNYLNIFFPLCLLWLLCLGHSIQCTGLLVFFWKYLIFYEVSLRRRKTSGRLSDSLSVLTSTGVDFHWQLQTQRAGKGQSLCPKCQADPGLMWRLLVCHLQNWLFQKTKFIWNVFVWHFSPHFSCHFITYPLKETTLHHNWSIWKKCTFCPEIQWNSVYERDQQLPPRFPKMNCGQSFHGLS